jgi:hypothetical protein
MKETFETTAKELGGKANVEISKSLIILPSEPPPAITVLPERPKIFALFIAY